MKCWNKILGWALSVCAGIGCSSLAYADCSQMGDSEWNALSVEMASAYDRGEYDVALEAGKRLTLICNRSPVVNYTMSEIYRKTGKEAESGTYVRRATEYLTEYPVPQALAEKIWYRRAEFDTPYKKQAEALSEELASLKSASEVQNQVFVEQMTASLAEKESELEKAYRVTESRFRVIEWTGTGVALVGLAAIIGGSAMVAVYHDEASDNWKKLGNVNLLSTGAESLAAGYRKTFNDANGNVKVGAGILTGGAVAGLIGTFFAIYGYLKAEEVLMMRSRGESLARVGIGVSPTSLSMTLDF